MDKIRTSKVCKDLSIAPSTITDWEKGRYEPKADKLQAIADYFNVSFAYIKGWDEEKKRAALSAYSLFNVMILSFNFYPAIISPFLMSE